MESLIGASDSALCVRIGKFVSLVGSENIGNSAVVSNMYQTMCGWLHVHTGEMTRQHAYQVKLDEQMIKKQEMKLRTDVGSVVCFTSRGIVKDSTCEGKSDD